MKKYSLIFAAFIFAGDFAQADKAANDYLPGSGRQFGFTETQTEDGATLSFTDYQGKMVSIKPGGAFVAVVRDSQFLGYKAKTEEQVRQWGDGQDAAAPFQQTLQSNSNSGTQSGDGGTTFTSGQADDANKDETLTQAEAGTAIPSGSESLQDGQPAQQDADELESESAVS